MQHQAEPLFKKSFHSNISLEHLKLWSYENFSNKLPFRLEWQVGMETEYFSVFKTDVELSREFVIVRKVWLFDTVCV